MFKVFRVWGVEQARGITSICCSNFKRFAHPPWLLLLGCTGIPRRSQVGGGGWGLSGAGGEWGHFPAPKLSSLADVLLTVGLGWAHHWRGRGNGSARAVPASASFI